ncbi:transposase [Wenzhouxiangella sp. AB-CW3]|uniref:REP-associated tyrosine transposase n=1 Tax=Wenzhouxiangella sp. AB-CW3 TaxID=2771012 RepID=UPI00168A72DD|nr:transposase [Wenzhouxiangella sp. AB-CW3]QOC21218.1 transposase [Wenzhouxiangella sp. AB-CW3]
MARFRRYFQPEDWVFLTLVTGNRRPWLRESRDKRQLLQCMRALKRDLPFRHLAHVILDDHLHWLLIADEGHDIPALVSSLKRRVCFERRDRGLSWRGLWQARYYDHILRDDRDFRVHMDYIHYNPVRHGYVAMARQYRWSSFHAWVERGLYEPCWGMREPDSIGGLNLE